MGRSAAESEGDGLAVADPDDRPDRAHKPVYVLTVLPADIMA